MRRFLITTNRNLINIDHIVAISIIEEKGLFDIWANIETSDFPRRFLLADSFGTKLEAQEWINKELADLFKKV